MDLYCNLTAYQRNPNVNLQEMIYHVPISRFQISDFKYLISITMGTVILAGIFITNQQIVSYQEQDVEESKQVAIDSFQRLADRKERRLETIAAGLVGLYRGSTPIEPVEFQSFVSEITRITPDLDFVVVTQAGRIVQSYPDTSFVVGEETNKVLGKAYLRNLQDEIASVVRISNRWICRRR